MKPAKERVERFFVGEEETPKSKRSLLYTIVLCVGILIIWSFFAELDEVTRGEGKVIPSLEIKTLQSLEGGIVDEFMVSEGDPVKKGQVLIRLRDIEASSDLSSNQAKYLGLKAAIVRLQAEAEGKEKLDFPEEIISQAPESVAEEKNAFFANKKRLEDQLQVIRDQKRQREQEISELRGKISDLQQVIRLAQQERDMLAPVVDSGAAPKLELLQLDRSIKEKQSEINSLQSSIPRINSSIREMESKIGEVISTAKADAQQELSVKTMEAKSIEEQLSAFKDRKTRTEIKSPVDGVVKDIKINTVGGVVRSGENIMEIVPSDDQLMVEAKISPADIAFIRPEQKAMIKVTAYDYSIYGSLSGEVVAISADTIANEKGEYFYRVRLRTDEKSLIHNGESLPIIPGMITTVEILTGNKTLFEYIVKPFKKTLNNALKER